MTRRSKTVKKPASVTPAYLILPIDNSGNVSFAALQELPYNFDQKYTTNEEAEEAIDELLSGVDKEELEAYDFEGFYVVEIKYEGFVPRPAFKLKPYEV